MLELIVLVIWTERGPDSKEVIIVNSHLCKSKNSQIRANKEGPASMILHDKAFVGSPSNFYLWSRFVKWDLSQWFFFDNFVQNILTIFWNLGIDWNIRLVSILVLSINIFLPLDCSDLEQAICSLRLLDNAQTQTVFHIHGILARNQSAVFNHFDEHFIWDGIRLLWGFKSGFRIQNLSLITAHLFQLSQSLKIRIILELWRSAGRNNLALLQ